MHAARAAVIAFVLIALSTGPGAAMSVSPRGRAVLADAGTPGVTLPPGAIPVPTTGTFAYVIDTRGIEVLMTSQDSTFNPWMMLTAGGSRFQAFVVQGDYVNSSDITISAPIGQPLAIGSYVDAISAFPQSEVSPGLSVSLTGFGCQAVNGKFDVDALAFAPTGELLLFQATFEEPCGQNTIYGRIRIENSPPTATVVLPPPSIALPAGGSFLYLNSMRGDYVGVGAETLYTSANAQFSGTLNEVGDYYTGFMSQGGLPFEHFWSVEVAAPRGQPLAVGSYTHAMEAFYRDEGRAGLSVGGDSRGCSTVLGQFDVDELALWPDGEVRVFQVTFEQHCEGFTPALFGRWRYEAPQLGFAAAAKEDVVIARKGTSAVINGTVSCGVGLTADVSGRLSQADNKGHIVAASFTTSVDCVAPVTKWSVTVVPEDGAFVVGAGTMAVTATGCVRFCHTAVATRSAKLTSGKS